MDTCCQLSQSSNVLRAAIWAMLCITCNVHNCTMKRLLAAISAVIDLEAASRHGSMWEQLRERMTNVAACETRLFSQ